MTALSILALAAALAAPPHGPLTLWYDRPAEYFEETLVIGNGRLGAAVYSGVEADRLSLNDITLWTGEPDAGDSHPDMKRLAREKGAAPLQKVRELLAAEDYPAAEKAQRGLQGHFSESYQPLGILYINYGGSGGDGFTRSLDLADAVATAVSGSRTVSYFASSPDSAIVIRVEDPAGVHFSLDYDCPLPHEITRFADGFMVDGYAAWHALPGYYNEVKEKFLYDPGRGIHFRTVVRTIYESPCAATVYITSATSFAGSDRPPLKEYRNAALRQSAEVMGQPYEAVKTRAVNDYKRLFDRVSLSLGDYPNDKPTDVQLLEYADSGAHNPGLEVLYFQYGRYLLICSSRTPGVPANLQGLWNESVDPPWSCNYTVNINLEENYWAAESAALPEMHNVLFSFLKGLSANGKAVAGDFYAASRGWAAGHNSDIWAMATPVGLGTGDPCWANWNMAGAWLSTHIWEHYLFGRDRAFLAEYYPVLKGAAEFCLDWLVSKDGYLLTSPSTSPENLYRLPSGFAGATLYGGMADIAMIRECLTDAALAAAELGVDSDFEQEAREALAKLLPYRIDSAGKLAEWYHDWDDAEPQHRHQSHLFGLYPGHQIQPEGELAEACSNTLKIRGDETTGWSCGWRVNLYARLHDADGAYRLFRRLLRYVSPDGYKGPGARHGGGTYPNLLDAHSPFQIDGNFGGCAGVLEMLVQSSADEISLLPACPPAWKEGSLSGVRTRAGLTLAFSWKDGHVTSLKVLEAAPGVDPSAVTIHRP